MRELEIFSVANAGEERSRIASGRACRSARAGVRTVAAAWQSAADLLPSSLRRSHEAPLRTLRRARSDAPYLSRSRTVWAKGPAEGPCKRQFEASVSHGKGYAPGVSTPSDAYTLLCRRAFLARSTTGLGAVALASLLNKDLLAAGAKSSGPSGPAASKAVSGALEGLHYPAKARRIIYLFQSGAPSHIDLFD